MKVDPFLDSGWVPFGWELGRFDHVQVGTHLFQGLGYLSTRRGSGRFFGMSVQSPNSLSRYPKVSFVRRSGRLVETRVQLSYLSENREGRGTDFTGGMVGS